MTTVRNLTLLLLAGLVWSDSALAYVDPVNGAMLLQIVASGAAGVVLLCRRVIGEFFRRLKARLTRSGNE